jgi:PTS system galactitol-specific IIB component
MKQIIVACGGGIASSGTVATKINERLKDAGLANQAHCEAVDIKSLDQYFAGSDLYVSITPVRGKVIDAPIPVINGMPLLTGIGADACFDQIVKTLGLKK